MSHMAHHVVAHDSHPMRHGQTRLAQTNLVSNGAVPAALTDPQLVNAWGLAAGPTSPWWVNDNGTGLSTLYNGAGAKQGLVVTDPSARRQSLRHDLDSHRTGLQRQLPRIPCRPGCD